MLPCILTGCQEVEKPDSTDNETNKRTSITEKIDLSKIAVPKEVAVYSAVLWEKAPEEIAHVFLGDGFKEDETHAEGRTFVKNTGTKKEQRITAIDGGMAFFGTLGHAADNGVNFSGKEYGTWEESSIYQEMAEEYNSTGVISNGKPDGKKILPALEGRVNEYLQQVGMEGYALDAAALFHNQGQESCLMYWKQWVDGIPLSDIYYQNTGNRSIYNYRHNIYDPDFQACASTLRVCFLENKLIKWNNSCITHPDRQLGKYPPVPPGKAYEKVKACYPPAAAAAHSEPPSLERAELQYQMVSWKKKYYLYPIWLFGVCKKTEEGSQEWEYYIMDAVTGDFFSDIPAELL